MSGRLRFTAPVLLARYTWLLEQHTRAAGVDATILDVRKLLAASYWRRARYSAPRGWTHSG